MSIWQDMFLLKSLAVDSRSLLLSVVACLHTLLRRDFECGKNRLEIEFECKMHTKIPALKESTAHSMLCMVIIVASCYRRLL